MSNIKENAQKFFCECCNYVTDRKTNFTRHMVSKKHQKKMNGEDTSSIDEPKTRKPRTPKEKKNNIEMSIQSDSDEEFDLSDFDVEYVSEKVEMTTQTDDVIENENVEFNDDYMYELQNKNSSLEDEVYELKYELQDKIKEIKQIECKYVEKIDDIEIKTQDRINEIVSEKHLLSDRIQELEEENELKDEKIRELMEIIAGLKQQKFVEEPKQNIELIVEPIVKPVIQEKPKKKIVLSKIEIEEPKVIISEPVPQSKLELEILRKLEILENQIPKISQIQLPKKSKKSPKNYGDEPQSTRADRDINNYRDTKHLMFQSKFKKLCRNSKYNKFIKYYNYTDSNGINRNIMLPANLSMLELETTFIDNYTRGNQNIIYEDAFKHLLSNVNYRHIPFICTNQRNYTFKVLDFDNDGEWVNVNQTELIEYLKPYISILWETFYESINNLVQNDDINDEVMKQLYDIPNKKCFLHDTSRYQYVLANTINPLSDTKAYGNKQTDAELFQACLINYIRNTFTMSIENFTPPEEYDDSIDREVDYSQNFNNVYYEPYHNKPMVRYVRTSNVWNDED